MTTPDTHDSATNGPLADDQENCASRDGELSDATLDGVAGGRIITTVTTRPSGSGGTDAGTTGSGSTSGSTGGFTVDVYMTPAAPSPIPIPYPNLKI